MRINLKNHITQINKYSVEENKLNNIMLLELILVMTFRLEMVLLSMNIGLTSINSIP
jgi:hypothetical protein